MNILFGKTAGVFLGYLNEYPVYWTQGYSNEELQENLKDLLLDIELGQILYIGNSNAC